MKKIYYLLILMAAATTLKAQKGVTFKFKYKPNHTYNMAVKSDVDMSISMKADSATMAGMAASGMKQPMLMTINIASKVEVKTTAQNAARAIPFTMTYNVASSKMTLNGEEKAMPPNSTVNQTITGTCEADGKMDVDTIKAHLSDSVKVGLRQMMDQMQAQIKFPDKPMAIGDTFTDTKPMNIPTGVMNLNYVLKTTYKLTDIKSDLAYFDAVQSIDMDLKTEANGMTITGKGTGSGTGKMVFSISKNYPNSTTADMKMDFDMDMGAMKMSMGIKSKTDMENTISAN